MAVVCLVIALLFVGSTMSQETNVWTVDDFPNPALNARLCGRDTASRICDPNGLIKKQDADLLDKIITEIYNTTDCPCNTRICRKKVGRGGYEVAIVLMNQMKREKNAPTKPEYLLTDAARFSGSIYQRWRIDKCHEAIIILFSLEDNTLYTVTGSRARRKLTDTRVEEISNKVQINFGANRDIAQGLTTMLELYRAVLMGQYSPGKRSSEYKPRTGRQYASEAPFTVRSSTAITLGLLSTILLM